MAEKKTEAVPERATPVEPAEPTPQQAITGATFAERAAASKAVSGEQSENKAVTSTESKTRRK